MATPPNLNLDLHDRPGRYWNPYEREEATLLLRSLASTCLSPLPDYNCLSTSSPNPFTDKLLVLAFNDTTTDRELIAFTSAVYLPTINDKIPFVLHTGLTCVAPAFQRSGVTIALFYKLLTYMATTHPEGFWISSLAEIPSSLGSINKYATKVFPSPSLTIPSPTHLAIADAISRDHREAMLINSEAEFEKDSFVFRGSNRAGSCFRKDVAEEKWRYREGRVDEFYRGLFRRNEGDEVLQVGFMDTRKIWEAAMGEERLEGLRSSRL